MAEPESGMRSFPVSWEELHRYAKALSWRLADKGPWEGIVAIARGGLVPAAIVGRELEVRLIDTIIRRCGRRACSSASPATARAG